MACRDSHARRGGARGDLFSRLAVDRGGLASASAFGLEHAFVVLLGLAACLALAPLALYITLADD